MIIPAVREDMRGKHGGMAELVDVQDLGSCGAVRVGSSPTARTKGGGFEEGLPSFSI